MHDRTRRFGLRLADATSKRSTVQLPSFLAGRGHPEAPLQGFDIRLCGSRYVETAVQRGKHHLAPQEAIDGRAHLLRIHVRPNISGIHSGLNDRRKRCRAPFVQLIEGLAQLRSRRGFPQQYEDCSPTPALR